MPAYGSTAGVQARLGGRTLDGPGDSPTTADVSVWLDEVEALVLGAIHQGAGKDPVAAYPPGSRGGLQIRLWVEMAVGGLVREAHAATGGDGGNEDGRTQWERVLAFVEQLRTNNSNVLAGLETSGAEPSKGVRLGSHVTDSRLRLSEADYAPIFSIGNGRVGGGGL